MKRRIRNEDRRESSSLPSKKRRHEESREEPCEICGSVGIAGLMMICFKCRNTREHTYCARVFLPSVPLIWICESCRFSSRVLLISGVAEDQMDSETKVVDRSSDPEISLSYIVNDHETAKVRANDDMEEVVVTCKFTSCEISADVRSDIHQPLQQQTSPLAKETSSVLNDSSQDNEQHRPNKRRTFQLMGQHITL